MRAFAPLVVVAACTGATGGSHHAHTTDSGHAAESGHAADSGDTGTPATFTLSAPASIALPYVSVGDARPSTTFAVQNTGATGSTGALAPGASGPFDVQIDTSPFAPGEVRIGTVTYTGTTDAPVLQVGTVGLAVDGQTADIPVAAVVGDAAIPAATWATDDWGACTTVLLPSAPFPYGSAPYADSSVMICVPTGLSDRGNIGIVTHFHGWNATIDEVDNYEHLHAQAALSGRDAVFVLPQGPVEAQDGDFGKLDQPDGLSNLARDVVSVLYRDGYVTRPVVGPVVLTSHSGGYNAVADALTVGGLPIAAIHLYDSMYGDEATYLAYAESGGTLRSSYTSGGGTDGVNADAAASLASAGLDVSADFYEDDLRQSPVSIGFIDSSHDDCLSTDQSYARWLAASGLPRLPAAPPEILSTVDRAGDVSMNWRADAGFSAVVQGSADGVTWTDLVSTTDHDATVPAQGYLRVEADVAGARPSNVYGATGQTWLIVDGFDRIFGGSWSKPTHDFPAQMGAALTANGATFSVASHEAVAEGRVSLGDYTHVLWLLGDESTADRTFDDREKSAIEGYVSGDGKLVVSGSEVGYATDGSWLSSTLHARYVSDSAGTDAVEGWTLGVTYPEDYPDVLDGDDVIWQYGTGGGAAVGWSQRVVVVGFALETPSAPDRAAMVGELIAYLGG